MSTFTLDTSGKIDGVSVSGPRDTSCWFWRDLTPFQQGYVEALFAGLYDPVFQKPVLRSGPADFRGVRFSDLSPDALALILRDCEARRASPTCVENTREAGRSFWQRRQLGQREGFPPLAPYLSDDGKVCLREAKASSLTKTEGE